MKERKIKHMLPIVDHNGYKEYTRWSDCGRVGLRIGDRGYTLLDSDGVPSTPPNAIYPAHAVCYDDARWNVERALDYHTHLDHLDD